MSAMNGKHCDACKLTTPSHPAWNDLADALVLGTLHIVRDPSLCEGIKPIKAPSVGLACSFKRSKGLTRF